jgi:sugar lactone lactonase YvrE
MATDVHLSNGIDWSPDDRVMYYTDSLRHAIWAYDFDLETGEIDGRRPFARVPDDAGVPDGLCVDAEGFVWRAHWGGWRVTRYAPDGRIDRVIELPAAQITCPVFGGPNLDVHYVSSAANGLTGADFAKAPDGGGLFTLDAGVRGEAANRFAA